MSAGNVTRVGLRAQGGMANSVENAQFLAVCRASTLAEEWCISSPFARQSRDKRGASLRRARPHLCQLQPTTNSDTLSAHCSPACLLGSTPSPQQALQGDAAHQAQRRPWLTPNDAPGPWETRRDYRSSWTLSPCHPAATGRVPKSRRPPAGIARSSPR